MGAEMGQGSQITHGGADTVEIVLSGLDAWARGDREAVAALLAPGFVAVRRPPLPDAQTYRGADGLQQMWADWTGEFDGLQMEIGEVTRVGNRVITELIQRALGQQSGVEVEGHFWAVYACHGGRITRMDAYASRDEALAAASGDGISSDSL